MAADPLAMKQQAWPVIRSASYTAELRALKRRLSIGRSRGAVLCYFKANIGREQRKRWLARRRGIPRRLTRSQSADIGCPRFWARAMRFMEFDEHSVCSPNER